MSKPLRIFISSTMRDDLENEREAVCDRLKELNFVPVNAESWLPDGSQTWPRIVDEIHDSHLFVLLLGRRYGWIPASGPGAGGDRSVTHMEYLEARRLKLPILSFHKRLDYEQTDRQSDEARKRDAFRKEVADWGEGHHVGEFERAKDLAADVVRALIQMLSNDWAKAIIAERVRSSRAPSSVPVPGGRAPILPPQLVDAVARRNAVLFAGSGMSLAAGLPSAVAFARRLSYEIEQDEPGYDISPSAAQFSGTATDLVLLKGRAALVTQLHDLMHPPQGLEPSLAHRAAVRLFDTIVTTNYDELMEQAAQAGGRQMSLVEGEIIQPMLPASTILKLHGSWSRPDSLVITESDVLMLDRNRPKLWSAVLDLVRTRVVVIVGMSIRDPSIIRLLVEAQSNIRGYAVMPGSFRLRDQRLDMFNLKTIDANADSFFAELDRQVG
jgi:hypothetical protein